MFEDAGGRTAADPPGKLAADPPEPAPERYRRHARRDGHAVSRPPDTTMPRHTVPCGFGWASFRHASAPRSSCATRIWRIGDIAEILGQRPQRERSWLADPTRCCL
jgi:hypothetical protein